MNFLFSEINYCASFFLSIREHYFKFKDIFFNLEIVESSIIILKLRK